VGVKVKEKMKRKMVMFMTCASINGNKNSISEAIDKKNIEWQETLMINVAISGKLVIKENHLIRK